MSTRLGISSNNASKYCYLEPLTPKRVITNFRCPVAEYNEYLFEDALRSLQDHSAKTWLLRELETGSLAAYMSLIADAIKLSIFRKRTA